MPGLDERVSAAGTDPYAQEAIIREYKPFILKCASDCCKRYITDTEDEWSVALSAFSEALRSYCLAKGAFLTFAKLVIRRRLYDYFDANQRCRREIPIEPALFSGEADNDGNVTELTLQIREQLVYEPDTAVAEEIQVANAVFAAYGFSFFDLTECSPKAKKTKEACAKAAACLLKSPDLMRELRESKKLPLKIMEENMRLPRKILERHRKYIIAVVELLSGEYPHLADYLHAIRKELSR